MKLAFSGRGRYTEYEEPYRLYIKRSKKGEYVDSVKYRRIIREYCRLLSDRLVSNGHVDLPKGMGLISAAAITRKLQYLGDKVVGYGKIDYETGLYDGNLKAFGIVFLPDHAKNPNMRSFGFVANRKLFKKVKEKYNSEDCGWQPIEFNDEMI